MKHHAFSIEGSLVIYCKSEVLIGVSQYRLLNQIIIDGSINASARNLKMSYQHAWHMIDKMNQLSPIPIVIRKKGGKDGGGCTLSQYGHKLLNTYAQNEAELSGFLKQSNMQLNNCLL